MLSQGGTGYQKCLGLYDARLRRLDQCSDSSCSGSTNRKKLSNLRLRIIEPRRSHEALWHGLMEAGEEITNWETKFTRNLVVSTTSSLPFMDMRTIDRPVGKVTSRTLWTLVHNGTRRGHLLGRTMKTDQVSHFGKGSKTTNKSRER